MRKNPNEIKKKSYTCFPNTRECSSTKCSIVLHVPYMLDRLISSQGFLGCLFNENIFIYMLALPGTQVAEGFPEHTGIKESKEGSVTTKQLTPTLPKIHSRNFRE